MDDLKIFDGGSHPALTAEICAHLDMSQGRLELLRFANGEFSTLIKESIRGQDVFLVQTAVRPVHENLVAMLVILDALKRASARRVTAVIPHFPYARQDQKTRGREPISAKLMANLITTAGADGVIMMDLHTGSIQGFFDMPTDHLTALPILASYFEARSLHRVTVVSPDAGGVRRARRLAERLKADLAVLDKRRARPNEAETLNVIGEVGGRDVILFDDMVDTAGTMAASAALLRQRGARDIYVCATHAVFSDPALERLATLPAKEIVVTNSIPIRQGHGLPNLTVLSVASLLAEAILRIHRNKSVSELFV